MTRVPGAALRGAMDLTEWNYLQRFARTADEEAFAFLVQRYGPLVLGVCRRQTGDTHLAEDAFQATFLVLARRAGDLKASEPLANWLFGVALRTARQMRSRRYERNRREQDAAAMKTPSEPRTEMKVDEATLEPLIDSALLELPERLRKPLVLCALQGKTYEQAATELQLSHDAVRGRIAQARDRLRELLERRGVAVPAALLLTLLGGMTGSALSLESARLTAHAAAQWTSGGALVGPGAENAAQAAGEVLRSMSAKAWLGWGATAAAIVLVGTLAVVVNASQPAQTKATGVTAVLANPATPPGTTSVPAAGNLVTRQAAPIVVPEQVKANDDGKFELGEGAANLLTVADVKFDKVAPVLAAQQLSKQFNVNIHFSDAALEEIEKDITLDLPGLTGIEALANLARYTNTELKFEDGNVVLRWKGEPAGVQTTTAKLPPKPPGDF